jgi:hypothetical protein
MYDDRARCELQLCVIHTVYYNSLFCIFVLIVKKPARDSLYVRDNFI